MTETEPQAEVGFEIAGEFYRWSISDHAKDLMLIDRFTQMPAHEFFELIQDDFDRGRGPVMLAMMACSIRRKNPDWSLERIIRTVMDLNLTDVSFVGGDEEVPPEEPPQAAEKTKKQDPSGSSSKKSNGSPEPQSETSPETQE